MDLRVLGVALCARISNGKLPVDLDLLGSTLSQENKHLTAELVNRWYATVQTQPTDHAKLAFNHVQPTSRLWRVDEFEPLGECKRFLSWQLGIKRRSVMGVEIVLHQSHLGRCGLSPCKRLAEGCVLTLGTLRMHLSQAPSSQRFNRTQQRTR